MTETVLTIIADNGLPPPVAEELLHCLPPVLRAVVKALGVLRAKDFLLAHGGVNWEVPRHRTTCGLTPAELGRLHEHLKPHMDAAGRIYLPKADKILMHARNYQINIERQYTSIKTLALRYRLSGRHILNVCRDDEQLDLF